MVFVLALFSLYTVDNLKQSVTSFIAEKLTQKYLKHPNDPEIPLSNVAPVPFAYGSTLGRFKISGLQRIRFLYECGQ